MTSLRALRLHQPQGKVEARLQTIALDDLVIKRTTELAQLPVALEDYIKARVVGRTVVRIA